MTWPPGSHYYYHFLFTAIALSISPLDWSRFMAAFAILWSLVVSQDLDDPKKTLGVDKVGTEEYECLTLVELLGPWLKMVDEVDECFLHRRPQWNPQH